MRTHKLVIIRLSFFFSFELLHVIKLNIKERKKLNSHVINFVTQCVSHDLNNKQLDSL